MQPLLAEHLSLQELDMHEALDMLNALFSWGKLYEYQDLRPLSDAMMERLQREFAKQAEHKRTYGIRQAPATSWVFDCSHLWRFLSKLH